MFIAPGNSLGVLGGGQLGRMFAHAAERMGYGVTVLDPDGSGPAAVVATEAIEADYLDVTALDRLAAGCAAITTEFENVPAEALRRLAEQVPVAPSGESVAVCQDRLAEKAHFETCGVRCAPHARIASASDIEALPETLFPGILKTARLGYDGRGQAQVPSREHLREAWDHLGATTCILEARMPLAFEISVIVARDRTGACVHLPVQQNLHRDGILAVTRVPSPDVPARLQQQAVDAAERVAAALGYVGVLCVEFFVLSDGSLLANEMAPRPHNSGHYSIDACDVSQFDLQVRTLTGAPLVAPRLHSPAVMLNLLGDLWFTCGEQAIEPDWPAILALPGAHLHLYGKTPARRGRKMGHVTFTATTAEAALSAARRAADVLGLAPSLDGAH